MSDWTPGPPFRESRRSEGVFSDRAHPTPHTRPMTPAPTYADWKALRTAILALIAAGVTGQAKAFLKAVREAKAAAVVLLFALARSLWPEDEAQTETEWKPHKPPGLSRLGGLRLDRTEDAWRNPSVRAYLAAAEVKAFAVNARAKARRTHEARRLIDRTWRSRRRRESG
jgi:hypothetical protein